jgi:hypothetical protein
MSIEIKNCYYVKAQRVRKVKRNGKRSRQEETNKVIAGAAASEMSNKASLLLSRFDVSFIDP